MEHVHQKNKILSLKGVQGFVLGTSALFNKIKSIKRLFLNYVIFNDGGFVMKQIVIGSDHAGYK